MSIATTGRRYVSLFPILGLPLLLAMGLMACGGGSAGKLGQSCGTGADCESGTCWELQCAQRGAACETLADCKDGDPCTVDACAQDGKCLYLASRECHSKTCLCADSGAVLDPGDCTWPDAHQCSAWDSVVQFNQQDSTVPWPDGTQFCMQGCCISLKCP